MKIAQVAPLYESVPPRLYGGTERVVAYLCEELVGLGHQVTLFASGDSQTPARLVAPCPQALRLASRQLYHHNAQHILQLEMVTAMAGQFDVIHFHTDCFHYPLARRLATPHLSTLHGRQDLEDLVGLYREFDELPLVAISHDQRRPLPWVNWVGTVHHGLPEHLYQPPEDPDANYLAFLGRISPEKRLDRAIEIAKRFGLRLKVAAKIDVNDEEYFAREIRPLLAHPLVEFVGEIGEAEKSDFLGHAYALLFPIEWCEPFGLAMIEAMACGAPVVAWRRGSVPEVVDEGVTGFIVNGVEEAVAALRRVAALERAQVREHARRRFSARRMAEDYLALYQRLAAAKADLPPISEEEELSQADA